MVTCTDGRILRVNPAACALAGRTEEELLASTFWELVHPADHAAVGAQHEELRRDGRAARRRSAAASCAPTAAGGGSSPRAPTTPRELIFSVVRDITGREDLELERLATLFDNAPLGMAVMAPDGALRRVNRAARRTCSAARRSELLERTVFELVADEDSRGTLAMALGAGSRAAFQFETRLRRADSHPLTVLFSATLVTNARHEPVHYVCQLLDITARAEAQERLELNEAKLAEAQQIARLGSWEWEIATDRVTWSDELYRIYGVRPEPLLGSYGSNLDRVHADDRARVGARHRERGRRAAGRGASTTASSAPTARCA